MAGVARRSGGHNRIGLEAHQARGTFRRDRHAHLTAAPVVGAVVLADRKRVRGVSRPWLKGRLLCRDWQQLETVTRRE